MLNLMVLTVPQAVHLGTATLLINNE